MQKVFVKLAELPNFPPRVSGTAESLARSSQCFRVPPGSRWNGAHLLDSRGCDSSTPDSSTPGRDSSASPKTIATRGNSRHPQKHGEIFKLLTSTHFFLTNFHAFLFYLLSSSLQVSSTHLPALSVSYTLEYHPYLSGLFSFFCHEQT